jgi:hypothetical protein
MVSVSPVGEALFVTVSVPETESETVPKVSDRLVVKLTEWLLVDVLVTVLDSDPEIDEVEETEGEPVTDPSDRVPVVLRDEDSENVLVPFVSENVSD